MSATILAAKIVAEWDELAKDSAINREEYLRNLLVAYHLHVAKEVIHDITEGIRP